MSYHSHVINEIELKGWSAFAGEDIEAGQFVCQYAGELLGSNEAAERLQQYDRKADGPGHALLVQNLNLNAILLQSFRLQGMYRCSVASRHMTCYM